VSVGKLRRRVLLEAPSSSGGKFYELFEVQESNVVTAVVTAWARYGKLGTDGTLTRVSGSYDSQLNDKRRKGYDVNNEPPLPATLTSVMARLATNVGCESIDTTEYFGHFGNEMPERERVVRKSRTSTAAIDAELEGLTNAISRGDMASAFVYRSNASKLLARASKALSEREEAYAALDASLKEAFDL
jgi:hypothetical protein